MNEKYDELRLISAHIPIMTKERFAELTGLPEGVVQGHINKGILPTLKTGRRRMINVAKITSDCIQNQ
jgi:hypothetical protein